jgi:hypothetical protein
MIMMEACVAQTYASGASRDGGPAVRGRAAGYRWLYVVLALFPCLSFPAEALAAISVVPYFGDMSYDPPRQNTRVMELYVTVASTYAVQSVRAQAGGIQTALAFVPSQGPAFPAHWSGTLSMDALQRGTQTLVVTATDVNGEQGSAQLPFLYDLNPVITVQAPSDFAVARPQLRVAATCQDDDPAGCASLTVRPQGGNVVASGTTAIDQIADLSASDPTPWINLVFEGTDSLGQMQQREVVIAVEGSPRLTTLATVQGQIVAVDATRILLTRPAAQGSELRIFDRGTQQYTATTHIGLPSGPFPTEFALVPGGALLMGDGAVYEWNGTELSLLGGYYVRSMRIAGPHAGWSVPFDQDEGPGQAVFYRDLAARSTTQVTNTAWGTPGAASNGDVVFATRDGDLYRWRAGTTTLLPSDSYCQNPLTDGINVAYKASGENNSIATVLLSSQGEEVLDPNARWGSWDWEQAAPERDYRVLAGWTAYTAEWQGARQVYLRDQNAQRTRLTQFGAHSTVDGLNPRGEVMLISNAVAMISQGRRYFASADTAPVEVSGAGGQVFWIGDEWELALQGSLFRVSTGVVSPPDGGVVVPSDGGLADAGVVDAGVVDAGVADAEVVDAGLADAGVTDGAAPDGGVIVQPDPCAPDAQIGDAAAGELDSSAEPSPADAAGGDSAAIVDAAPSPGGPDAASDPPCPEPEPYECSVSAAPGAPRKGSAAYAWLFGLLALALVLRQGRRTSSSRRE